MNIFGLDVKRNNSSELQTLNLTKPEILAPVQSTELDNAVADLRAAYDVAVAQGYTLDEFRGLLDNPAIAVNNPAAWQIFFDGATTEAGEVVDYKTAIQDPTVQACVRKISQTIGTLPIKLMQITDKGHQEATDNPLYDLLRYEPNPYMSAVTFFERFVACMCYLGNGYAQIERDKLGRPLGLYILNPLKTKPYIDPATNQLWYLTSDGETEGQSRKVPAENILHCPLMSMGGLQGVSPVDYSRLTIGLSLAQQKAGARQFGNTSRPISGILKALVPKTAQQREQVRLEWEQAQAAMNAGRIGVLSGDWNYQEVGLTNEASQWLQSRKFSLQVIASLFGVPSHLVGDDSKLSGSNSEEIYLQFLNDTIRPYIARIENEFVRKLVPSVGRSANKYFVRIEVNQLNYLNFVSKTTGFMNGVNGGWMTDNEVRRELGMNVGGPELDVFRVPVNFFNATNLLAPTTEADKPLDSDIDNDDEISEDSGVLNSPAEKNMAKSYTMAYRKLFDDAFTRYTKRNKKDFESFRTVFEPVLTAISDLSVVFTDEKRAFIDEQSSVSVVSDATKSLFKRSEKWSDADSEHEFVRAVKAIHVNTVRNTAEKKALQDLAKAA